MAILNHGSTLRTADGGQTTTTIVTAANIGTYGVATNSTYYVGTTQNIFNRASGAQTLTGVSIDGNAANITAYTINQNVGTANAPSFAGATLTSTLSITGGDGLRAFRAGAATITSHLYWANTTNTVAYNWQLDENNNAAMWGYTSAWGKLLTVTSAGAFSASGDVRAPIFYDSANTAYYLDPANTGTSLLVAGNVGIGNTSPSAKLHVSGASYTTASAANNNVRFEGGGGNGLGFGTIDATSTYASWIQSGYVPNFTTATYALLLNPLGGNVGIGATSPLTKLDIANTQANGITMRYDTNTAYQAWIRPYWNSGTDTRIDFAINRTANVTPDVIMSVGYGSNVGIGTTSPSQKLHVVGTGFASTDFRAPIFYDSDNTAYYIDPASTSVLNKINLNSAGVAAIQWRAAGVGTIAGGYPFYNNASYGSINIEVSDNDTGGLVIDNEGVTVYGAADNGQLFRTIDEDVYQTNGNNIAAATTFWIAQGADGGGTIRGSFTSTGDFRAPIFYDSNDTGYYIDAASTSRLNAINVGASGVVINNASTAAERNLKIKATGSNPGVGIALYDSSDNFRVQLYGEASNYGFLDGLWASWDLRKTIGGNLTLNNNTTYYLNPASTTNLNVVNSVSLNGNYIGVSNTTNTNGYGISLYNGASAGEPTYGLMFQGTGTFGTHGSVTGDWATYFTMNNDNTRGWIFRKTGGGGNTASISAGGIITASSDVRAPIFYDSGDTTYYVDPAGTSRVSTLYVAGTLADSASLNGRIILSGNLHIDAYGAYDIYCNYYSGRRFRTYKGVGTGAETFRADTDGIIYAFEQFRTPIVYDYNNTSYYVDPASTSNLNIVTVNDVLTYGVVAAKSFSVSVNTSTYWTVVRPNGSSIATGYVYKITLCTTGTGTDTGEQYLLANVDSAGWVIKTVTKTGSGSNWPYVFLDAGVPKVKTDHPSLYTVTVLIEELNSGNTGGLPSVFGLAGLFTSDNGTPKYRAGWFSSDNTLLHSGNYGAYSAFSGSVTSTYGNFTAPGLIIGDAQYGFYVSGGNVYYKSASGGVHYWRNIANSANTMSLDNSGNILLSGYINASSYIYTATYLQTGGNLIYPSGYGTTQRLEVSNSANNNWIDGLTIAPGGIVTAPYEMRSPIFYDSDDTTYYLDPANTTLSLKTRSSIVINNASAPNNLAMLNIGYNGGGETRAIDIQGGWSGGENKSITFTHASGSTNIVAQINAQHNGPGSKLRWGKLYHSGDSSAYTMELISETTTSAYLTVVGSVRAPIFYDSNDTNYYLNPASSSVLNTLSMAGTITGALDATASFTGGVCTAASYNYVLNGANDTGNKLVIFVNGSTRTADGGVNALTIRNDGGTFVLGLGSYLTSILGSSVTINSNVALHAGNYNSYALPLTGGQITGNTTFSADNHLTFGPNSTWGSSIRIGGNGYTATGTEMASVVTTDGNLHLDAAKSTNGIYLNWYGGTSGVFFGNGSSGQVAFVSNTGNASFSGVVDATQFRDASNTAYYVDPASTSVLNNLRAATISAANHGLTCVYYGGGATPTNGYLITTNIDYSTFNMPTVIIEGYAYGNGVPIHLEIVWYAYLNSWTNLAYTNLGNWNPGTVSIGTNASGKVCLHLSNLIYYGRFNIRCIYDQGNAPLEGWTVTDATTSALTRVTTISKVELATSITGNSATVTTNANLTGHITSVGNATSLGSFTSAQLLAALTDETGTGANVFATSPTLVSPILGTPTSGNLANCTFPTLNQNTTGTSSNITAYTINQSVGTGNSPTFVTITGTAINIAGNGAGADPYGTIAVTQPAGVSNYSYYGLTRQANIGTGFGLTGTTGALGLGANAFWFGSATSTAAGVMGSAYIAFNGSNLVAVGTADATQFRDKDNTALYCDPTGTSLFTGLTVTNTITGSVSGNAATAGGLAVHAGTNNEANKIVRTDVNGYIQAGWINTISGDSGTTAIDKVYASNDGYIRYYTPANFRTVLDVPTRGGSGASGSWGISVTGSSASCTGNAATVTNGMYLSGDQFISGAKYFTSNKGAASTVGGANATYSLEAYSSDAGAAGMSFHRGGYYAVNMGLDPDNVLRIGGWSASANRLQLDMSGNLTLAGVVDATQFRDSANTAYYVDPASTSNLNAITAAGNITAAQYYTGGWFRNNSSGNGLYNEATGEHFYSDAADMWNVASANGTQGIRLRTGGHNGTIRGYFYGNDSNDVGFLNNAGSWRVRVVGGDYVLFDGSSVRAQIFYDSNDTGYYTDPAGTSILNVVRANSYVQKSTSQSLSGTVGCTIDVNAAGIHVLTLAASTTISSFTYNNRTSNPSVNTIMLVIKYGGTASITWTNVLWANGTTPSLTSASGYADVYMLTSYQGGAATPSWIGTVVAQALVSTSL